MKIQIASDLHTEMHDCYALPKLDSDILILAGDIAVGKKGINFAIAQHYHQNKPVLYIAGNHEFYGYDYIELQHDIRDAANEHEHVHFLEKNELVIDETRFLGTTLWTDFLGNGEDEQEINLAIVNHNLNDHRLIKSGERPFTSEDALKQHQLSRQWLTKKLGEPFYGKTVVITHHAPSLICQHPDFEYEPLSTGFLSDMGDLVKMADLWVFGHTHYNVDTYIGQCRLISNQAGYPHENMPISFKPNLVIDL